MRKRKTGKRGLLGRATQEALRLREGEVLTVQYDEDEGDWVVYRQNGGRAAYPVERSVIKALQFNPAVGMFMVNPDSPVLKAGAQVRVRS
jgi:hypothetical protein